MKIITKNIPESMKQRNQWFPWKGVKQNNGKITKIPKSCHTGKAGSSTDSSTWGSFEQAVKACKKYGLDGIGYVFTEDDPFVGIDLDNCRNSKTGAIDQWAKDAIDLFDSLTEVSPSGTGFHIFVTGKKPGTACKKGDVEMYEKDRFFTVTGNIVKDYPATVEKRQDAINEFYNKHLANRKAVVPACGVNHSPQIPTVYNPNLFSELEQGGNAHYPSASEADLAWCNMLVKKYGSDPAIIDKHFRESKRFRSKWVEKHSGDGRTYGQMTIDKAIAGYNSRPEVKAKDFITTYINKSGDKLSLEGIIEDSALLESFKVLSQEAPPQFESTLLNLKSKGLKQTDITTIRRIVKAEIKKQEESIIQDNLVVSLLPDAPFSNLLTTPGGYNLTHDSVIMLKKNAPDWRIATAPVVLTSKYVCINTKRQFCESSWADGKGGWVYEIVPREVLLDQKRLVELLPIGFPVSSVTARPMVGYLQLFESLNEQHFQKYKLTDRMGWQENNCFLIGDRYINDTGKAIKLNDAPDPENNDDYIHFKAGDEGDKQFFNGFKTKGSIKEWLKVIELIQHFPVAVFMLLAAFSTMVMKITGTPNFLIDLSCTTSSGKTTLLKIIASIFGNPVTSSSSSIIRSWNATQVSVERQLGLLCGIPYILDDTKLAGHPDMLSQVIYEAAMGQGRGRGSIKGTAKTASWQTILMTSGESKLVDLAKTGGGIHGRVLEITESPFRRVTDRKAKRIAAILNIIYHNFGGIGVEFAKNLIQNKDKWPQYNEFYKKAVQYYSTKVRTHGVGDRMSEYIALIRLTGKLLNDFLGIKLDYKYSINHIYGKILDEMEFSANIAENALISTIDLLASQSGNLWCLNTDNKQPLYGWLGAIDSKGNTGIIREKLDSYLLKKGFEPQAVVKEWRDKNWLRINEKKGLSCKINLEGRLKRMIVIKKSVLDEYQ